MEMERGKDGRRETKGRRRPELHGDRKIKVSPPREGAGGGAGEGAGLLDGRKGRSEGRRRGRGRRNGNYWVVEDKDI